MPNLAAVLKDEIRRLARKEVRDQTAAMQKQLSTYRRDNAQLKRNVAELEKKLGFLEKQEKRRLEDTPEVTEEKVQSLRFSPKGVKRHRDKLSLSAADYGKLVGVSQLTIYNWEQGKSRPRPKQLASLAEVRGIGKREAQQRLEVIEQA